MVDALTRVCNRIVLMPPSFSLSNNAHNSCCCLSFEVGVKLWVRGQSSPPKVVSHTALVSYLGAENKRNSLAFAPLTSIPIISNMKNSRHPLY